MRFASLKARVSIFQLLCYRMSSVFDDAQCRCNSPRCETISIGGAPNKMSGVEHVLGDYGNDLHRANEVVLDASRIVQQQKGLIVRLGAAGVDTSNAELTLRFLEKNLRRFQEYRDALEANWAP